MVAPGTVISDRFELLDTAGEGGMGVVYVALDRTTGERVALKRVTDVDAPSRTRFVREVALLSQLRHPRIVRFLDAGFHEGEPWMAMAWVRGEPLSARLAKGPLGLADALSLGCGLAEALGVLHRHGIVHRDVKPANVILEDGDCRRPVLIDLGVARSSHSTTLTPTEVPIGTPAYMSPEQALASEEVGPATDVFALGLLLFECLTGRNPFRAASVVATLLCVVLERAPRLRDSMPELPQPLDDALDTFLAKSPESRPPDGQAAHKILLGLEGARESKGRPSRAPRAAVANAEHVLFSVVLAVRPSSAAPSDDTRNLGADDASRRVDEIAARFDASSFRLTDGSFALSFRGTGEALDQVLAAGRGALALRNAFPDRAIALATARAASDEPIPVGVAVDGVGALGADDVGRIRLDELSARLLDRHCRIDREAGRPLLVRELDEQRRGSVLGRATPCVGRRVELATLKASCEEVAESQSAHAVMLLGEAGTGKSRLLAELAHSVDHTIWTAHGERLSRQSPFSLLGDLVRRLAQLGRGEPERRRRQRIRALWDYRSDAVDRWAETLDEAFEPGAPGVNEALRAAREDPRLMRNLMRNALVALVSVGSRRGPLIVCVDDLQWVDTPSLEVLDAAWEDISHKQLLLILSGRPSEAVARSGFEHRPSVHRIELGPLSPTAASSLARTVLGDSTEDLRPLVERSLGNPLLLEELLRARLQGATASGGDTVTTIVSARLEALPVSLRRPLRAAALFGKTFWAEGVEVLLEGGGTEGWIDGLIARELIERSPTTRLPETQEFSFRHEVIAEAAYALLGDRERRLGHRVVAAWLRERGESNPIALAEHLAKGDRPFEAIPDFLAAARRALLGGDLEGAQTLSARAQQLGPHDEDRSVAAWIDARVLGHRGQNTEAIGRAKEGLSLARKGASTYYDLLRAGVTFARRLGQLDDWLPLVAGLPEIRPDPSAESARLLCLCQVLEELVLRGFPDAATPLIAAVEASPVDPDDVGLGLALAQLRAVLALSRGDSGRYLALLREVLAARKRLGDDADAIITRVNVGYAANLVGAWDIAESELSAALEDATARGLGIMRAAATMNLGWTIANLGRLAEARQLLERAVADYDSFGDTFCIGATKVVLARVLLEAGEPSAGEVAAAAERALRKEPAMHAYAVGVQAACALSEGRTEEAVALSAAAEEVVDRLGAIEEGEGYVRWIRAQTLAASGSASARAARDRAIERLHQRAAAIDDPAMRAQFLSAVPEHRRTLEPSSPDGVENG